MAFEADTELEEVKRLLDSAGFPTSVIIDENFGRSLRIVDPEGVVLQINESNRELFT